MATTKIWDVRGRVDKLIKYVVNPEKTIDEEYAASLHAIENVIEYTSDEMKTEQHLFVTGINCDENNAIQEFMNCKNKWQRTGGIVAYHGYQSFAAGEVDADTAHRIGVELAKILWEDRFQVVVTTHCNTGHFHNHFAINSISFIDGKRYYDNKDTYNRMREVSDRLCKEHGLSVIRRPKEKGMNYAEWKAEHDGKPTLRGAIREAIDIAVRGCQTETEFYDAMDQMGFIIDTHGKYPKIKHIGDERFIRFKSLGEGYDFDEIIDQVYENDYPEYPRYPEQESPRQIFADYPNRRVSSMGYTAIYHCYCKALVISTERPKTNRKIYALVRQDTNKMQRYSDQNRLLSEHHIDTPEQLREYKVEALSKIDETVKLRQDMKNALRRAERVGDEVQISKIKFNIDLYSRQLKKLRREVVCCDSVLEEVDKVREKLIRIEQEKFRGKETKQNEHISRSGRPDREDES